MKQAVAVSIRALARSDRLIGEPISIVIREDQIGWLRYTYSQRYRCPRINMGYPKMGMGCPKMVMGYPRIAMGCPKMAME